MTRIENRAILPDMKEEFGKHLALQSAYRFLGPSRDSWTHYIDSDKKGAILDHCLKMLTNDDMRRNTVSNLISGTPQVPVIDFNNKSSALRLAI